jgi:hypothetical protein
MCLSDSQTCSYAAHNELVSNAKAWHTHLTSAAHNQPCELVGGVRGRLRLVTTLKSQASCSSFMSRRCSHELGTPLSLSSRSRHAFVTIVTEQLVTLSSLAFTAHCLFYS